MSKSAARHAARRPRRWLLWALGLAIVGASFADPWGWWRDEQWFFDGPERVGRQKKRSAAARAEWERYLMGDAPGPNAGPILRAADSVAALVHAEWNGVDWPRVLDEPVDADELVSLRELTESEEVRYLIRLLERNRDVEHSYYRYPSIFFARPDEGYNRFPGILSLGRLLTVRALVLAEDGDFDRAFETLHLGLVVAQWAIKEQPTTLTASMGAAITRSMLRNVEELCQRQLPSSEVLARLRSDIERLEVLLDIEWLLAGDIAFQEWVHQATMDIWDPEPNVMREPQEVMLAAVADPPWSRDEALVKRVEKLIEMPMPEFWSLIDTIIETRYRAQMTLEALRLLEHAARASEAAVWTDPFTGGPLRTIEMGDRCVVYSIGRDREDNGGVDAGRRSPYWDVVWRLPCYLIPTDVIGASEPGAS